MSHSWSEVQALATRAAVGAGVPHAQALSFGTAAARHLAAGREEASLEAALAAPDQITALAVRIETVIEAASLGRKQVRVPDGDGTGAGLVHSWIEALPCRSEIDADGADLRVTLALKAHNALPRPARLYPGAGLWAALERYAEATYVPDSAASRAMGAGPSLMDTD